MKPSNEIEELLNSPGGSQRAGMPVQRPRTLAKRQVGKPSRLHKDLGPDFLALLFAEHKETDAAEISREQTAAGAAKAPCDAGSDALTVTAIKDPGLSKQMESDAIDAGLGQFFVNAEESRWHDFLSLPERHRKIILMIAKELKQGGWGDAADTLTDQDLFCQISNICRHDGIEVIQPSEYDAAIKTMLDRKMIRASRRYMYPNATFYTITTPPVHGALSQETWDRPKSRAVSWDVYRVSNPRSLALALLLD